MAGYRSLRRLSRLLNSRQSENGQNTMARSKASPLDQPSLPGVDFERQPVLPLEAMPIGKKSSAESGLPNLGRAIKVTVPNFSDPKRPKTCLEVDFPIVPINALSQLEGNAGKPIYQMSKWWARRRSSVFRSMLLAAAMQAPTKKNADGTPMLDAEGIPVPDETEAARAVWDVYYANHQKAGNFQNLKVLDCFMGGGTTLVEGSRLGFQVTGVDLNPVAWFVVKNELACTDPEEVRTFFGQIEAEVKPVIQPFYVTECPRGHAGRWFRLAVAANGADELMPAEFDPLVLRPEDRKSYRYEGPEVIYTFWAKHGPCSKPGCGHRTPIFRSPVIAEKKLGVKYLDLTCKSCKTAFHAELGSARMAPSAERVVLQTEPPFTELSQQFAQGLLEYSKGTAPEKRERAVNLAAMVDSEVGLKCPKCGDFAGQFLRDVLGRHCDATKGSEIDKKHLHILPPRNSIKPVYSYLLIDPKWLSGSRGTDSGRPLGGYPDASCESTKDWYFLRRNDLDLIEIRGRVRLADEQVEESNAETVEEDLGSPEADDNDRKQFGLPKTLTLKSGRQIDPYKGTARTVKKQLHFTCGLCGLEQPFNEMLENFGHAAPQAVHSVQGYCPTCDDEGRVYRGRFFGPAKATDTSRLIAAEYEWSNRKDQDLAAYWPQEELPFSYMTHHANFALPKQGYTHWWKMFNSRQLLVHSSLLRAAMTSADANDSVRHQALGAVQQYLRNQNGFVFWNPQRDTPEPFFSNPNYAPKTQPIENNVFGLLGRGNWTSTVEGVREGLIWCQNPWEPAPPAFRGEDGEPKLFVGDPVLQGGTISCHSSSDIPELQTSSIDLVVTDPPFGDNIFYSDLANFFHAWLRLPLSKQYPALFEQKKTPNSQEALAPRLLPEKEANEHYQIRLTACWAEAFRVLKDGGLLAFTFHHSEDAQWAIVLESLFEAGFLLEQTFPIASDEQKGEGGQFGAKGTEYDIIHVCRKRLVEPLPVSWAKMRQWVKAELGRLRFLLATYKARDLSDADIRVILRGKALEFYSRHYGRVYTAADLPMPLEHALAGINQLLDEGTGDSSSLPPSIVQPVAYQYLRLFTVRPVRPADDVNKSLFGTAIRQRDFADNGWIDEKAKTVSAVPVAMRFEYHRRRQRREMKNEIDQAHFLMGGAMANSGVNLEQELSKDTWLVRRSVDAVLEWYSKMAPEQDIRNAAMLARSILRKSLEKLRSQPGGLDQQLSLFNDWDESE
jgi:putative DNA methylase